MFKRIFQLSLVAGLVVSALWAANDSFVGEWKLNTGTANSLAETVAPSRPLSTDLRTKTS